MARRIPTGIKDVAHLGRLVDSELQRLSVEARQGFVADTQPVDKSRSYFFMDSGVPKFFNASTGTEHELSFVS